MTAAMQRRSCSGTQAETDPGVLRYPESAEETVLFASIKQHLALQPIGIRRA